MRKQLFILTVLLLGSHFLSASEAQQTTLTSENRSKIVAYLKAHWQSPEAYVVKKFENHDVVLLAEDHGLKHNLELVHRLIPSLYKAGVYNVGMEFGAAEDQEELDRLVNAETYDENAARRLMFSYNVGWAYKEYMEVYRKAWEFNRSLPKDAPRFRIVNLSYIYDWSGMHGPRTPRTMQKVFGKGEIEKFRAAVVQREVFDKHQKILILTGTVHAFTRYRYPEFDNFSPDFVLLRPVDFGNLLESQHPGRNFTIMLHVPWESSDKTRMVRPLGGIIDDVMSSFQDKRIGFDTKGSPFDSVVETSSYYATGYPDFTLATLADGYIYEKPFSEYEGCTVDEGFLTDQNWKQAKEQFPDPDWNRRPATREDYMKRIRNFVDMKLRLRDVF